MKVGTLLRKRDVIENFDRIMTDPGITRSFSLRRTIRLELYLGRYYVIHTSGSSGEVGCYAYSPEEWTAGIAHGLRMHPFAPRVQRIAFFGAPRGSTNAGANPGREADAERSVRSRRGAGAGRGCEDRQIQAGAAGGRLGGSRPQVERRRPIGSTAHLLWLSAAPSHSS